LREDRCRWKGKHKKMKKPVYESERDGKYRCDEMTNQDNDSLNKRNYNLKTHMEWSDSPTYEQCKDEVEENRDNQKSMKKA
jgi:hypothetical protein